jgi:hypothetical protein
MAFFTGDADERSPFTAQRAMLVNGSCTPPVPSCTAFASDPLGPTSPRRARPACRREHRRRAPDEAANRSVTGISAGGSAVRALLECALHNPLHVGGDGEGLLR